MKKLIRFCLAVTGIALVLYAAYLVYVKFFADCGKGGDDLYEDGQAVCFSERVKKAAEKQLERIS